MSVPITAHYGLKKPDGSEKIKPDDFNYNSDIIDAELYRNKVITGTTAPTTATAGGVGQLYLDTITGVPYQCKTVNNGVYTWKPFVREWRLLTAYTVAGSYSFKPTDYPGITELGGFIIGGGGSGAACAAYFLNGYVDTAFANGGGSGRTNIALISAPLNASYPVVVGAGGTNKSATDSVRDGSVSANAGSAGGSSSFNGVTALGGSGGSSSATLGADGGQGSSPTKTVTPAKGDLQLADTTQGKTYPLECSNPFDFRRCLIAGGYASATNLSAANATTITDDYGLSGSAGKSAYTGTSVTATKGTSYGCGGGGAAICIDGTCTATSAAGCDGAVFVYGR